MLRILLRSWRQHLNFSIGFLCNEKLQTWKQTQTSDKLNIANKSNNTNISSIFITAKYEALWIVASIRQCQGMTKRKYKFTVSIYLISLSFWQLSQQRQLMDCLWLAMPLEKYPFQAKWLESTNILNIPDITNLLVLALVGLGWRREGGLYYISNISNVSYLFNERDAFRFWSWLAAAVFVRTVGDFFCWTHVFDTNPKKYSTFLYKGYKKMTIHPKTSKFGQWSSKCLFQLKYHKYLECFKYFDLW